MLKRSYEKEYIDLGPPYYTEEEYTHCLHQLNRIGRVLGGDRAGLQAFRQLPESPTSILDVGCGGGGFTVRLAQEFPEARVVGIDCSESAIAFSKQQAKPLSLPNLSFACRSSFGLKAPDDCYDIITSTLVCHHMNDAEIVKFLVDSKRLARKSLIINDLNRNRIAYAAFALIAPVLFRNRLITHDGLLSIKRGFTLKEWEHYLTESGFSRNQWEVFRKWAFRWIIKVDV